MYPSLFTALAYVVRLRTAACFLKKEIIAPHTQRSSPAHTHRKQDTAKKGFSKTSWTMLMFFPTASFLTGRRRCTFTAHFFLPPSPEVVAEGATGVALSHPGSQRGGSLCNRMLSMIFSLLYRVGAGVHFSHWWRVWGRLTRIILQTRLRYPFPSRPFFLLSSRLVYLHLSWHLWRLHFVFCLLIFWTSYGTVFALPASTTS